MEIRTILDTIYELPEVSKDNLTAYITELAYPKGYCLLNANKVERN